MRNPFCWVFILALALPLSGLAKSYSILNRSKTNSSFATRTVHVEILDNKTLSIEVDRLFYSNDDFFETIYQIRRNHPGDRLGSREFWIEPKATEIKPWKYLSPACLAASGSESLELKSKLSLAIQAKLNFDYSVDNLKNWSQLFCFSQDTEAFLAVLPDLQAWIAPKFDDLIKFRTELRKMYLNFDTGDKAEYLNNSLLITEQLTNLPDYSSARAFVLSQQHERFIKTTHYKNEPLIRRPFILVTHASRHFDLKQSIKTFANKILEKAAASNIPIYFLMHNDSEFDQSWMLTQTPSTKTFFSKNGEHNLRFTTNQVISMGGFYNECLRVSQIDLITRYFLDNTSPLNIHFPISGIYSHKSINFKQLNKDEFIQNVVEGSIFGGYEIDDDHGSRVESDMNKLTGIPDLNSYQLNVFTDGEIIYRIGSGKNIVNLRFWSNPQFEQVLSQF